MSDPRQHAHAPRRSLTAAESAIRGHRLGPVSTLGVAYCSCGALMQSDDEFARHLVGTIRSLPVEQRMEAMGMVGGRDYRGDRYWMERPTCPNCGEHVDQRREHADDHTEEWGCRRART